MSFTGGDYVRVEEVASADLDCVESSFADEAADGLDVKLPALGVFGYCCSVIFSVHRSYYITREYSCNLFRVGVLLAIMI